MCDNQDNWRRFFKLRKKVFDKICEVDDGYHKSYEGAMDVTFSFQDIYRAASVLDVDLVTIELHCYLLVNGRHIKWEGHTFEEALNNAEEGINEILKYVD